MEFLIAVEVVKVSALVVIAAAMVAALKQA